MQMLAHSPGLATHLASSPPPHSFHSTIRAVAPTETPTHPVEPRTATPLSIDSPASTLGRRTQKSASLSLRARDANPSSQRSTPARHARGNTAPADLPHTPELARYRNGGAESALSFTPSVRGKQLATWFSALLGR
ncbi:Bud site selection protein 6 [Ascochyta rabiei]|uniref:Bud site selection protein 6 n=1 Tax=Didymella rabiei TaxID=5454 RepID=UPI0022074A03|nr:Bud site selection protein 6 [Ascochyta rabiei]UPX16781.1 Bud site selection protein 6 [Ascochyta rabiei]